MNLPKLSRIIRAAAVLAASSTAFGQTVTETVLGQVTLQGPTANRPVISPIAPLYAAREKVDGKERYVTVKGPGESFDRIHRHGVWIQDRLVYLARKEGKEFLVDGAQKIELKGTPTSPLLVPMPWPSPDFTSYCAFVSDGKKVRWYRDGKVQPNSFSRLASVLDMTKGQSAPLFVGVSGCTQRVVGQAAAGKAPWDVIHAVRSSHDGSIVYVYGERASLPLLYQDDKEVLREKIESFAISRDGKTWVAVVNRPADETPHMVILENGAQVAEADVHPMDQTFHAAADGSTWVWQLMQEDQSVILRQLGKEDRKLELAPQEFHLSEDGKREAYIQIRADRTDVTIDGQLLGAYPVVSNSFRFGPGTAFAFAVNAAEDAFSVVSHLGEGPKFTDVSRPILFLPDGQPVYTGHRAEEHFIVVGKTAHPVMADDLHGLASLRVEGSSAIVLGKRGEDIIQFKISL